MPPLPVAVRGLLESVGRDIDFESTENSNSTILSQLPCKGSVVKLNLGENTECFLGWKSLVERRRGMGVKVIEHNMNECGIGA